MTVKSDNITNMVITALLLFDEYEEMKNTYKNILNDADAGFRALIKKYEMLFFRKINLVKKKLLNLKKFILIKHYLKDAK